MRSPEHRRDYSNRTVQHYDEEITGYLQQGAFTILPPQDDPPPDPPIAPQPFRLTPSAKRHKNMAFAILPEPGSRQGSRSPSPTGRVSPFKGRGFNPIGSRHASPVPSPPPEEEFSTFNPPRNSKIPRLSRRGSASVFGEKIEDFRSSPNKRKLHSQLSQSLTNIAPKKLSNKPPPSPRKHQGYVKNPAFQRLSPIVGSSPEPSQSQSSPSKSRSQPQSRFSSPSRNLTSKPPARGSSRPTSRTPSRNASREPSPNKDPTSPTRIPVKHNYRNIQAKVNSFSRSKPKVPLKPQVLTDDTDDDNARNNNVRPKLQRKESVNRSRTSSKTNVGSKTAGNFSTRHTSEKASTSAVKDTNGNTLSRKSSSNNILISGNNKSSTDVRSKSTTKSDNNSKSAGEKDRTKESSTNNDSESTSDNQEIKKNSGETRKDSGSPVRLSDLLQPSTTAVVSSTTSTVTQPLKIDARFESNPDSKTETTTMRLENKMISPIVDGRVLSATSVTHAMNKMNDSVLDTQTLMKDHGLPKLSPAASTIIAMSSETKPANPALDTKNATTALPSVDSVTAKVPESVSNHINNNHVTTTGIMSARALEDHVQNNMSKLISPDHITGNSVQKSVNDRIKEARTVVAGPIKITVKEKPMDVEVQSGNIRFPVDATNGLGERPGLPPSQPTTNDGAAEAQAPPKSNACTRFFTTFKNKMSCQRCKKQNEDEPKKIVENKGQTGCFSCRKKKPDVTINIENDEPKATLWQKIKCCGRNRVGTTGCFSSKRKDSWTERRDSILSSEPQPQRSCCSRFFRAVFCLDRCGKTKKKSIEEERSRRASMMSKKKSLTPSIPPEDHSPKLDMSLVEHNSAMKGAIPVLPVCLAWFCLIMNCIAPGTGTIFSGMFCLCLGIPRFSQKDGPKPRVGSFLINLIIGIGQFFTVLFCLVGWGWSIWWGVIMLKIARKHQKIKMHEEQAQKAEQGSRPVPATNQNHHSRNPERRRS